MADTESSQNGCATVDALSPREAMAIYVTIHDGEAVLCIAPGDHSVQRWRIGESYGKRIAAELTQHYLGR